MKKLWFNFLTIMAMLVVFAIPAFAVNYDYYAAVYKRDATKNSQLTQVTSGITFKVLTAGSDTAATITKFGNPAGTAVTNPVTTANFASATVCGGLVKFRTTASTVDMIVVDTAGGYTAVVKGFSPNDHSIIIDETPNVKHHGLMWFGADNNTGTNTGVLFDADTAIHEMIVEVVTVDAGETINVGTTDTDAAFRSGVSVATAGYVKDTALPTNADNVDYIPATTYGTYLASALTGSALTTNAGGIVRFDHVITGADNATLGYKGSDGSDTAAGYIHYWFTKLR
ncbi:MAG: hypothetical protein ABFD76_15330 [Smithella sp.]